MMTIRMTFRASDNDWDAALIHRTEFTCASMHSTSEKSDSPWYASQIGSLNPDWAKYLKGAVYVIWSYRTPIAWYVADGGTWYIPAVRYSNTTSHHQFTIRRALHRIAHDSGDFSDGIMPVMQVLPGTETGKRS